eukprot:13262756-Alexandrium_andersonii.AAC.1
MATDRVGEFRRVFAYLVSPHTTTAPSRSETNGVAERNIQSLSNCIRAPLGQSGLELFFWPFAARAAAFALNIREDAEGASAWEHRHGEKWPGPPLPSSCRMSFTRSLTDKRKKGKFTAKARPGIFLGLVLQRGHV